MGLIAGRNRGSDARDQDSRRDHGSGRQADATRPGVRRGGLDDDVITVEPVGAIQHDRIVGRSLCHGRIREGMLPPARRFHVSSP